MALEWQKESKYTF